MDYVVILVGLAALVQGLPYLVSPKVARKKIKAWLKNDDVTFRWYGAVACALAVGILYIGLF